MSAAVSVKKEPSGESAASLAERIMALCTEFPQGISDKALQTALGGVDSASRAAAINKLLQGGKVQLFNSAEKGLLYRAKGLAGDVSSEGRKSGQEQGRAVTIRGDAEEKLVYSIIEESGNKGTWKRDIRIKSNLVETQLNKVLKSLKSKKHIKEVKSVNSSRKLVYMVYNLEPDRSVTGGAWYSDQDFESEFVDILNQQCYRFLHDRWEKCKAMGVAACGGPMAMRNKAAASAKEVLGFISQLGISKVQLKAEDIETILDTLVFDGKVELIVGDGEVKFFRAIDGLLPSAGTGLMRTPCGGCPVMKNCGSVGAVNPTTCAYIKEWLL